MNDITTAAGVVAFWRDAGQEKWFQGGAAFDGECHARFHDLHFAAARRELEAWAGDAEGALALLLLLDQIPRNIFRGSGHMFATDGLAKRYAEDAIAAGHDAATEAALRPFFYLPFEHSEAMADQDRAIALFTALGDAMSLEYAVKHRDVIAEFGRFPHRNASLGRANTVAERAWLEAGGGF